MRRTDIVADTPLGDMCADRAQVPAARGSDYALPDQRSEVPHFAGSRVVVRRFEFGTMCWLFQLELDCPLNGHWLVRCRRAAKLSTWPTLACSRHGSSGATPSQRRSSTKYSKKHDGVDRPAIVNHGRSLWSHRSRPDKPWPHSLPMAPTLPPHRLLSSSVLTSTKEA
jgi:hypothetical protein